MQTGDLEEARALLNEIIAIGGTTAWETPLDAAAFGAVYSSANPDLVAIHVALDAEGAVAGFQWLARKATLPPDCADIATFARQNPVTKGVGTALFAATKAAARAAGFARINAQIRADNRPGLGYYAKMGFVDHDIVPAVPLRDGTPVDRIVKRFALAASEGGETPC